MTDSYGLQFNEVVRDKTIFPEKVEVYYDKDGKINIIKATYSYPEPEKPTHKPEIFFTKKALEDLLNLRTESENK